MKQVYIVGAGIAGLTAGVYALQSGFDVTIYESHTIPGGASTSWRRKGYLFEGGMHWLSGSSPEASFHKLWREIGALDDSTSIYNRDPFHIFELNGRRVCLYRDIDKLEAHFTAISPEDQREIHRLCRDLKKFTKMNMPITDIRGVKVKQKTAVPISSLLSMLPAMLKLPYYAKMSASEYAMRFQSPLLRQMLLSVVGEDNNATALTFTLATLATGDGGYPEGGSLGMAGRIAKTFLRLGGTIHYNTPVDRVIVKNGEAVGLKTGGQDVFADAVIVTQDTLAAIDTLFDPPIHEPWADEMRRNTKPILNTFLSVGVTADLSAHPESIGFRLEKPLLSGGQELHYVGINNYASYPGYAPEGCTALTSALMGDTYDWWKRQREAGTYEAEKEKLLQAFLALLAEKYPGTAGNIAVWDVATPLTYERYLHSYKGSWMSFMGKGERMKTYPSKPQGIRGLYFAGQRLALPGGLPVAAETGRRAVQHLCLDTDAVFQGAL